MKTTNIDEFLTGDKLYQKRARLALPILIRQAQAEQPITYTDLALELNMPNPRNLNKVLETIGKALDELSDLWNEKVPPLQFLVINKASGLPGEGISVFIEDAENYKKLSKQQKRKFVDLELIEIYCYKKWKKVLKELGLKSAIQDFTIFNNKASTGGYGGESEEHKKLKEYVAYHPKSIGLHNNLAPGDIEHNLPSGDKIDVFFENKNEHIGVEVKSARSNSEDITRGIYQCIKYQAVLEARQVADRKPRNVRTILALGCDLPVELVPLKNLLAVNVKKIKQ